MNVYMHIHKKLCLEVDKLLTVFIVSEDFPGVLVLWKEKQRTLENIIKQEPARAYPPKPWDSHDSYGSSSGSVDSSIDSQSNVTTTSKKTEASNSEVIIAEISAKTTSPGIAQTANVEYLYKRVSQRGDDIDAIKTVHGKPGKNAVSPKYISTSYNIRDIV